MLTLAVSTLTYVPDVTSGPLTLPPGRDSPGPISLKQVKNVFVENKGVEC